MPVGGSNAGFRKHSRSGAASAAPIEPAPTPLPQYDRADGDPNFMTSLARGLAVIQAFSQTKRQQTISQISSKTGFSRAAVRRCLYTLAKLGFAGSDDNRHFHLRGRVLLADLAPEKFEELLASIEFTRYTDRTVVSSEKLRQILRVVQRNGYSVIDQELEYGLRSMAVPIRNPNGKVVAALNVGAHAQRVSLQHLLMRFLPHLKAAAHELCMFLK